MSLCGGQRAEVGFEGGWWLVQKKMGSPIFQKGISTYHVLYLIHIDVFLSRRSGTFNFHDACKYHRYMFSPDI